MIRGLALTFGVVLLVALLAGAGAPPPAPSAASLAARPVDQPVDQNVTTGPGCPDGPPRQAGPTPTSASPSSPPATGGGRAPSVPPPGPPPPSGPPPADWVPQVAAAAPADNPLKGFVPYPGDYEPPRGTGFPHSMELLYFPVCAVMTGPSSFNWDSFEAALDTIANRGHQVIVRFYLDLPARPVGVPRYLLEGGLRCTVYSDYDNAGRSCSPDYENPNLRRAMQEFIRAYGQRFDADPRHAFIQLGLLGFWGEWHTFPHPGWNASPAVQEEVLQAYTNAFRTTRLLVRYAAPLNAGFPIGYHDDSFAWTTTCQAAFCYMNQVRDAGVTEKWRTQPMGGEIRPGDPNLQVCLWDTPPCGSIRDRDGNPIDYVGAVQATHVSWLWNHGLFSGSTRPFPRESAEYARAIEGARQLGYTLTVSAVSLPNVGPTGMLQTSIQVQNTGVAPFYYRWPVELAALDTNGELAGPWRADWDFTRVQPGEAAARFDFVMSNAMLPVDTYKLLLRVVNPLSAPPFSIASARPLRFANQLQDRDRDGWLTLGSFTVSEPGSPIPTGPGPGPTPGP